MEFSLLGGVEAYHAGVRVELGRRHERRLLALLLLEPGRIVATDRLLDLMWDGDPPPTARATLHTYVSRLRKRLAPYAVELHQRSAGYLIDVDPGQVDLHRFRQGLAAAREVADPAERARLLSQALELWRGLPMAGTASDALSHRVCAEPVDDWLAAVELHAEAELELGHHDRVGTELARLAEERPTRERLVAALTLALYRARRQSEALAVYTDVRRRLVADVGIE